MSEKQATTKGELFTEAEAAEFLRISRVTLWRERSKGHISFRRLPRLVYTQDDLNEYLTRYKRSAFATAYQQHKEKTN